MKKFIQEEIEIIRLHLIEFAELIKSSNINDFQKTQTLLTKLELPISSLTSYERALIQGRLKEYWLEPNKQILSFTDYELMLHRSEITDLCRDLDTVFSILNKIKKRYQKNKILFSQRFNKIEATFNSNQVYYSENQNGKLFKIGIALDQENILKIELDGSAIFSDFEFSVFQPNSFMNYMTPKNMMIYLDNNSSNSDSENFKRFYELIKRMI